MKIWKLGVSAVYLLSFIQGAFAQQNKFVLTVSAPHSADLTCTVRSPVNGYYFMGNEHQFELDASSFRESNEFAIGDSEIITVSNNFREAKVIASPGDHIEILFLGEDSVLIKGTHAEAQMLFNRLSIDDTRFRFEQLDVRPTVDARLRILDSLQQIDLQKIDQLLATNNLASSFVDRMRHERQMYYKLLWATDLFFTCKPMIYGSAQEAAKVDSSFLKAWHTLYEGMTTDWAESTFYPLLITRFSSLLSIDNTSQGGDEEPYALTGIRLVQKVLKDELLEYAWANGMIMGLDNNENEKVWIDNFAEFNAQFPNSALIPILAPEIAKVEQYHEKASRLTPGVEFAENTASFKSLQELFQHIKGKYYYVDLWATWCGPCKAELQHSIKLHDQLENIGYTPLYLSIDNDKADDKWREMVKGFPLKGLNIRVGPSLHESLNKEVPKFTGIPRYLIVNDKGEVVNWDAKRPSDHAELIKQLQSYKK